MADSDVSIAFVGSGGAGVLTVGGMLLEAACATGWHGFLTRSVGAQIRGGEAAAMLRLASHPIDCHSDCFALLIGIDWNNAQRFEAEIPLGPHSLVIGDPRGGEPPQNVASAGARVADVAFKDMIKAQPAWRANMIALGIAAKLIGLPQAAVRAVLGKRFGAKGPAAIETNLAAVDAGATAAAGFDLGRPPAAPLKTDAKRWLISGNEAVALGAVRGGIRFAAAYPITPATDILEWLASNLARVGGVMLQAEDELASINMIIGASYGGTPALTATSGPGLSLMVEALGLATAAEIPIVVVDVMRGGPSTGIPTKAEQSDLNIAVYGVHGDAPRLPRNGRSIFPRRCRRRRSCCPTNSSARRRRRSSGRPTSLSSASDCGLATSRRPINATRSAAPASRRWRFREPSGASTPPTASRTRWAAFPPAAPAIIARNSTSDATSWKPSTTEPTGRRSKAKESWP